MKGNMRYIAIDPGETTGICLYVTDEGPGPNGEWKRLHIGPNPHHLVLEQFLENYKPGVIILERFTYQQRDKVILTSVEYIGVVKLYHQKNPHVKLRMQMASQVGVSKEQKGFWTDQKIKTLDLWIPGKVHAMDATRHMLYYLTEVEKDRQWIHRLRPTSLPPLQ